MIENKYKFEGLQNQNKPITLDMLDQSQRDEA